jgi:hypothetical protein
MKKILFICMLFSCSYDINVDYGQKFETICINGHEYYIRSVGHKGYMAIKLTDNGYPVKCSPGKE